MSRSAEAWLDQMALVLIIPGWFIVTMVKGDGPGTKLTDILIPILSGTFWGLLVILPHFESLVELRRSPYPSVMTGVWPL